METEIQVPTEIDKTASKSEINDPESVPTAMEIDETTSSSEIHDPENEPTAVKIDETTSPSEIQDTEIVPTPVEIDFNAPSNFINRELSMLQFQHRVFDEAKDENNPLLERLKFLSIVGSNMDEFFMVRVGGLKMQVDAGVVDFSIDGMSPAEQLASVRKSAAEIMAKASDYWNDEIIPALNEEGIHILDYDDLTVKQTDNVQSYFQEVVFPVLTPLGFDPGHPFPYISNLSLSLAIFIRDQMDQEHFARVKVPTSLPRFVPIKRSSGSVRKDGTVPHHHYFVMLEELIYKNLNSLFPGIEIIDAYPFRVTRNADFIIQELEAGDLLETMEESVKERRFGSVVRLSINQEMPKRIREILVQNLNVEPNDLYYLRNPLGLSNLYELYSIERYDLKYVPYVPPTGAQLGSRDGGFSSIRRENIMIHLPYDSFTPVVEFLQNAARDPDVLAIKQTLYRAGQNSPVVQALLEARRDYGKQVAVLVELKARFDEESNIGWAKVLEAEGVHVIYGLVGLKTHSKIALVVRKEGEGIRRYVHLGTGNYNAVTAHLYEDLGMFTSDQDIGADATDLFNFLTGYSTKEDYRKLWIAPVNLRRKLEECILREVAHKQAGRPAKLIFKMNSLVDKRMITLLYEASQAGVEIDLLVRGICCMRPGISGVSENIRVISIVGRFLEHSRIYYFLNGGDEEIFMGSADLMPRNLNRRVEVIFPVEDPKHVRYIRDDVLDTYLADNLKARIMKPDGSYEFIQPSPGQAKVSSQHTFLKMRTK